MEAAHSKITSQGQISVPLEVRRKLGVGPGSVLEWREEGGQMIVWRAGRHTSADIHAAVFAKQIVTPHTAEEMKEGIRQYVRWRHARD